jgi:hypothetical protein
MDLPLFAQVLRRHWLVLLIGFVLAVVLALSSYYHVAFGSGFPKLTPRKSEVWASSASVLLTQRSQVVPVPGVSDPGRLAALANLYARLATSDRVLRDANVGGSLQANSPIGRTSQSALPVVTLQGFGATASQAKEVVSRGLSAFLAYVSTQQGSAKIPAKARVQLRILNSPSNGVLIQPRKKTLPIVVFLAVLMAAIAAAFVLDNLKRKSQATELEPTGIKLGPESESLPAAEAEDEVETPTSVRRWA